MPLDDAINLVAQMFESGLDNKQTGTGNNSRGGMYYVVVYILCMFTFFAVCLQFLLFVYQ